MDARTQYVLERHDPPLSEQDAFQLVRQTVKTGRIDLALELLTILREQGLRGRIRANEASLLMDRLELEAAADLLADCPDAPPFHSVWSRLRSFEAFTGPGWQPDGLRHPESLIRMAVKQYVGNVTSDVCHNPPLIVLVGISLARGGLEVQLTRLAALLSCAGFAVRVLQDDRSQENPGLRRVLKRAGVPVESWKDFAPADHTLSQHAVNLMRALDQPSSFHGLDAALKHYRPTVVHVMGAPSILSTVAIVATRAGAQRIILSARNQSPAHHTVAALFQRKKIIDRAILEQVLQRPDVSLVTNSRAGLASYRDWLPSLPATSTVTWNIVDVAQVEREAADNIHPPWPKEAVVVGGAFRVTRTKRPGLWLEVARLVARQRPDVHFAICGAGDLDDSAIALAKKIPNFHFLGFQSPSAPWIASFDTLLMTTAMEGLPNAALEAQALGVPVVASDVGGNAETFINGVTGYLVTDINDPGAYADAVLASLTLNRDETTATACRDHINHHFGAVAHLQCLLPLYGIDPKDHPIDEIRWKKISAAR